ncbi:MAG: peptidylprolyl isomerase [Steroidobacteraceae bacterium]
MKQILLLIGLLSTAGAGLSLAADTPPASAAPKPAPTVPSPQVQVVTSMGNFTIELNAERAPLTVAHFLSYVDQGYYSNTIFHRVVQGFVIQAGGFDADYNPKHAPAKVVNESGNGLSNVRGSVGMARTTSPHAADAQFFVNLSDNQALDPNQTRWGYAVFGRVIQGMDVVDKIGNVATGSHGVLKEEAPLKAVIILRIERVPGS